MQACVIIHPATGPYNTISNLQYVFADGKKKLLVCFNYSWVVLHYVDELMMTAKKRNFTTLRVLIIVK
jgi:hypothetical protein